jgi:hypothetical protein
MPSPPDDRAPRKTVPPSPTPLTPLLPVGADGKLPSTGGRSTQGTKFQPKYVPRLIDLQTSEYQNENWRS